MITPGARFRHLSVFLIAFPNKRIGLDKCGFRRSTSHVRSRPSPFHGRNSQVFTITSGGRETPISPVDCLDTSDRSSGDLPRRTWKESEWREHQTRNQRNLNREKHKITKGTIPFFHPHHFRLRQGPLKPVPDRKWGLAPLQVTSFPNQEA
jgi:hypothetical protein